MSDVRAVIIGVGIFLFVHILTWFQLNGQFFNGWFKNNNFVLALFGIPISYLYIYGTKYCYEGFGGLIWPGRFIGFACGMVIMAIFTSLVMNEGITVKTGVSLILATALVAVQVFWK
tara:strand:+ start:231 stop:581 length:351 start_codon:yes stop_codon:yes gene_type:complete